MQYGVEPKSMSAFCSIVLYSSTLVQHYPGVPCYYYLRLLKNLNNDVWNSLVILLTRHARQQWFRPFQAKNLKTRKCKVRNVELL